MLNVGSGVIRRHSPVREEWVDDIQTACRRTGTAFFFKQWGGVRKDKLDANISVVPSTKCLARQSRLLPESCDQRVDRDR